ncbi:amidinotransferase [Streptomyces yangpuensis]|uniref:amidinotransferase n=1 Tax=Streptomyces yangpuensis TaxID=1648182 RepID=UPI0038098A36
MNNSAVSSYNEWDPLEEVIVGVMEGAAVPDWDIAVEACMPQRHEDFFRANAGQPWPAEHARLAQQELETFASMLTDLGVTVTRPDPVDQRKSFSTPNWSTPGGLYAAMPRDLLLVVGDTIIEAPMAWRSRYFEIDAYRALLTDLFNRGGKWISAPKPQLREEWYDREYDGLTPYETGRYVTLEHEPTFDAADFIRCGRDIFAQRSHVTNQLGIDWVARHVGDEYKVHTIDHTDSSPMHIDASFMPIAPGKLLLNPGRIKEIPEIFKSWDVRFAPEPQLPKDHVLYMSSAWVSMNVFMVDEKRVVVEAGETELMRLFESWGIEPLPVSFRNVMRFGGCFHCVTTDVRRKGTLESYF